MIVLKVLGGTLLLGVIVNTIVIAWAWCKHSLAWPKDVPEGKEGSYFWEVYTGLPSLLLSGLLGFLGGALLWQNWWIPFVTGYAGFVLTLIAGLIPVLVASKLVQNSYPG